MGKDGFMTPKAIANRIKAKGLQKLRWYCQLCQKQCRDENGFKCHQMSDAHRRQMEVFGQNPQKVIEDYSAEFEEYFMEHLGRAHPHSRVAANIVYNEIVADRHHIHMNSTKWLTLSDFVKYLGREGKCKVEDTPKGWFITLIHKDSAEEVEERRRAKRAAAEREDEERHMAALQEQIERARKMARADDGGAAGPSSGGVGGGGGDLVRDAEHSEPIKLSLQPVSSAAAGALPAGEDSAAQAAGAGAAPAAAGGGAAALPGGLFGKPPRPPVPKALAPAPLFAVDDDDGGDDRRAASLGGSASSAAAGGGSGGFAKPVSKLEQLMQKELQAKARSAKLDHWLAPGIVVKVMSKELKEAGYYKAKGVVEKVIDKYVAEVAMLDSGDVIRVDQAQLETVIPSPGGSVLVVNGLHRGARAVLLQIDTARFQAQVRLADGANRGKEVWQEYEDICKLDSSAAASAK